MEVNDVAVSGTRRGPGWWMDRDGGWNPPELWPETTPPLPGWIRNEQGRWEAPVEVVDDGDTVPMIDLTAPEPIQSNAVRTPRHAAPAHAALPEDEPIDGSIDQPENAETPKLNLRYAEAAPVGQPAHAELEPAGRSSRWIVAAIAVVIALLLVVLLVL